MRWGSAFVSLSARSLSQDQEEESHNSIVFLLITPVLHPPGSGRKRPRGKSEITGAGGHEFAGEPVLLREPCHGGNRHLLEACSFEVASQEHALIGQSPARGGCPAHFALKLSYSWLPLPDQVPRSVVGVAQIS